MKDAWIPVIGVAAVAIISLAGAIYLRGKTESPIPLWWNRITAIVIGVAVAIIADRFGHLDWYFAIPLGALAYACARFPAYRRYLKDEAAERSSSRKQISN
ncbi:MULTISPECIES: hypothetical protein [unclassified Bradyrhizobium]|uniref:hypothetical protein n=1 Tax=unclassified Bradyrhizobium TaxID=2631580 RepID=UPI002FF228EA